MDNLWQLVHQNPQDFMSWTLLLQYCEQTNNMDTISRAYNQFLSHYPYCYAYWIKFAEFGRKLSNERTAFEMLEKAVTVFPNSIDIWIHYLQECIRCHKSDNHIIVLFERALRLCGSDYNSSDLWLLYLHWIQTFRSDPSEVTLIYDRLLQTPIKKLCQHFENFVTFVENNNPIDIINKNEYHLNDNEYNDFINNSKTNCIDIIQFKRSSELSFNVNHLKENETKMRFIRQLIINQRKCVFELTLKEITEMKYFEDNIKRPYFHINALDIQQLDNWTKYLNWQIKRNITSKVILLFERCLITCALYEHMWVWYTNYLIEKRYEMIKTGNEFSENFDINAIRDVFRKSTEIHLRKSFKLHNLWALFEEREGNINEALAILDNYQSANPQFIESIVSKINLFHRKGDINEVHLQFESAIDKFCDFPKLCSHLSIRYSRFLFKIVGDTQRAVDVLNNALKIDSNNYNLYLRLIDIEYQKSDLDVSKIEDLFELMITKTDSQHIKLSMTQRKLEFMQDFGFSCLKIQATINRLQNLMHGFDETLVDIKSANFKRFKNQ